MCKYNCGPRPRRVLFCTAAQGFSAAFPRTAGSGPTISRGASSMHSNRLRVEQADACLSTTRATELRAYLDRLVDTLMICETRGAVCKQQQLIALERLDGRAAGGRMQRLYELETAHKQLTAVYASHVASEDDGTDDEGLEDSEAQMSPVEAPVHGASTRTATPSSVHA